MDPDRSPSRGLRPLWIVPVIALACFLLLTIEVARSQTPYFETDLSVTRAVQATTNPGIGQLMRVVSWAGDDILWSSVVVVSACLAVLLLRGWRETVTLLLLVLVAQLAKIGVKNLIGRPRPTEDLVEVRIDAHEIYSFPSGHTVHYVVLFGFLFYLTWVSVRPAPWRWPLLALLGGLVLLVGVARIYLGAHWVTDIVGGYLLGGAVLVGGIALYRRWCPV